MPYPFTHAVKQLDTRVCAIRHDKHRDDFIPFAFESRAGHAAGRPAHGADIGFVKPNRQAALCAEDDMILAAGAFHADERIAFFQRRSR